MEKKITDEIGQTPTNTKTLNWVPAHEANIEAAIQDAKFEAELKEAFNQQQIVINQSQLNIETPLIDFSKLDGLCEQRKSR